MRQEQNTSPCAGLLRPFLAGGLMLLMAAGCSLTPTPISFEQVQQQSIQDLAEAAAEQEPITAPIDLYEAMARALKYNFESRLRLLETHLAVDQQSVAKFEMLPKLAASAGYNARSNYSGATSIALEGPEKGQESLVASTSQEKQYGTADVTVMWNVLDFGLSYVHAKQEGDKIMIAEERKRKTIQNIVQDVRSAYWKAACAELVLDDLARMLEETQSALEDSRKVAAEVLDTPKDTLEYQKDLLQNIRLLKNLIRQMRDAKVELAGLMNIRSTTEFRLAIPEDFTVLPELTLPMNALETLALQNRPELFEEDYRARITSLDARKALLEAFPSLNLRGGFYLDSNELLFNSQWWEAGADISLNLFKLFQQPAIRKAIKSQQNVDSMRRKALSMAIVTQVHLSRSNFELAKDRFVITGTLAEINDRLREITLSEQQNQLASDLEVIETATTALVAKMQKMMSYATLQDAYGQIINTIGLDILPEEVDDVSVAEVRQSLATAVTSAETLLAMNSLPELPPVPTEQ